MTITAPTKTGFADYIQRARVELNRSISLSNDAASELDSLRQMDAPNEARVDAARKRRASAEANIPELRTALETLERESAEDDIATRDAEQIHRVSDGWSPRAYTNERGTTYNDANKGQFLRDLFDFSTGGLLRPETSQRLLKHEQEARESGVLSERANSTSSFQGIVPPQYLIDQYALVARAGRPTANAVQHLPIPPEGMSLVVPRGTIGVSTAVQAAENTAVSNTDQTWANVVVPVFTVAGQADVSLQSIDRAEWVEQIIFGDLNASYALSMNQQVLSGTGTGGQGLGIFNTAGISQASAFPAAATLASFYSKIAGQINQVQTLRFLSPDLIVMHPRRWNWLIAQLDSSNRPLVVPSPNGPTNSYAVSTIPLTVGTTDAVGTLLGLPVVTDPSIPLTLGVGGLEDVVIVTRAADLLLWEDQNAPFELKFEQTLGNQLTTKLVAYGYGAFTAGRYPTSVGLVGGNAGTSGFGLTTVTF